jgi:putative FmdB family regulatory protein
MPFYEYECQSCKFYTEVMQKISDPPLVKCPSCGKRTLQKLVSAPVFRLKGSGWYETDFKSEKEQKRNLAAEREEPKPAAEDLKPAAEDSKAQSKAPAAAESAAKPAEPKTPSVTTAAAGSNPRAAASPKRPAPAKASTRAASARRAKPKPAPRTQTAKRRSRR